MLDLDYQFIRAALDLPEIKDLIRSSKLQEVYTKYFSTAWEQTRMLTQYLQAHDVDIMAYLEDTIPNNCFSIGLWPEEDLHIPSAIKVIGSCAFDRSWRIHSVVFDKISTEVIQEAAFEMCEELKEVILPMNIRSIEAEAFARCDNLSRVVYPSTLEDLGNVDIDATAFLYSPVTSIECIDGVKNLR